MNQARSTHGIDRIQSMKMIARKTMKRWYTILSPQRIVGLYYIWNNFNRIDYRTCTIAIHFSMTKWRPRNFIPQYHDYQLECIISNWLAVWTDQHWFTVQKFPSHPFKQKFIPRGSMSEHIKSVKAKKKTHDPPTAMSPDGSSPTHQTDWQGKGILWICSKCFPTAHWSALGTGHTRTQRSSPDETNTFEPG